jgi:hypothetical protein
VHVTFFSCDAKFDRSIVCPRIQVKRLPLECASRFPESKKSCASKTGAIGSPTIAKIGNMMGACESACMRDPPCQVSSADHDALPHLWLYPQNPANFRWGSEFCDGKGKTTNHSQEKRKCSRCHHIPVLRETKCAPTGPGQFSLGANVRRLCSGDVSLTQGGVYEYI